MQKLNRKIEYALMALQHMRSKPEIALTTAKEVSERFHAPFDATARVMQLMASRGWLRSEQGASGGYQLQKDLGSLTFLDLIQLIDGPTAIAKCLKSEEGCEIQSCNVMTPIQNLNQKLSQFYTSLRLDQLLGDAQALQVNPASSKQRAQETEVRL
jgi:Rrf2 family protein